MRTILKTSIVVLLAVVFALPVGAQLENIKQRSQDIRQGLQQGVKEIRQGLQSGVRKGQQLLKPSTSTREVQHGLQPEVRRPHQWLKPSTSTREIQQGLKQGLYKGHWALFQAMRKARKTQQKANRALQLKKIQEKRQEIVKRLKVIRDKWKQKIAERIYDRLNDLNERLMAHFNAVLDKIEVILGRIESRTDKAEANGLDVSAVRVKIEEAKEAIAASRSAIDAQSKKVYSFEVTGEEKLRQDVGAARRALHADLVKVRQTVVAARDATREVAVALAQIPRVDKLEMPTPDTSATPTESKTESE